MKLSYDATKRIERIYERVKEHYGPSKYYREFPKLIPLYETDFTKVHFGFFWKGELAVNFCRCKTWRQAIETLIHEYTHYLQHPGWYTRYDKMYGYAKNPYEIQANKVAEQDWRLFDEVL